MTTIEAGRNSLKCDYWAQWEQLETDERKRIQPLPLQKPCPDPASRIPLPPPDELEMGAIPLREAIERRRSRRQYLEAALRLDELSFLLWATQGLRRVMPRRQASLRMVPSGGARHPFETYLVVNRVKGVEPGLYRYLPIDHELCLERVDPGLAQAAHEACLDQYVTDSAVTFVWTVIPYRTEWRYSILSHKIIAIDAGHLCQNLYLAAEAIDAGVCAIGAYNQQKLDQVLGVDSQDEFAIYVATLGKVS
jgi:SagB-type dehydrogenase family enzyme